MIWVLVIAGAAVLFFLPTIAAVIRGTDPLWVVILLNVIPLGITWFGAWLAVFMFPRNQPAHTRPVRAVWDDPRYLYGAVPPAGTAAGVATGRTRTGSLA